MNTNIKSTLMVLASLAVGLVLGLVVVKSFSNGGTTTNNYYSAPASQSANPGVGAISSSNATPNHLDAGEWTQWNDGHFDDVELEDDLWVAGDLNVTGTIRTVGDTRLTSLVEAGSITTFSATSTVTAAQLCDSTVWNLAPASTTPTITLPSSSTLFADCFTANGDMKSVALYNVSVTSTILAAGTGGSLEWSRASSTIDGGASGFLTAFRTSTLGGYKAVITVFGD